jgi:hypothetical protein
MDSSMFKLASSVEELGPINNGVLRPQYREVSCQKAVEGNAFPNGQQEFRFNVSGATHWVPSKTFMVFDVTLSKADGTHLTTDELAPNMGLIANLYNSIELRMGGKVVQRVSQNLAQVDALLHRSSKSKTWLDELGEKTNFWCDKYANRLNEVYCEAYATGANPESDLDSMQSTKFRLIWRTCLPIMHTYGGALPSGDYSIVLNPRSSSEYKLNTVESIVAPNPGVNYDFSVDRVRLQVATVEGAENITNKQYALSLQHIECQANKILSSGLGQYNFSVSPATTALAVAFQDNRLQGGGVSPSKFQVSGDDDAYGQQPNSRLAANALNRLYIQYDGLQRPQPEALPSYVACDNVGNVEGIQRMTERYYETQAETGMIHDDAGPENLLQWQRRGPFYYFNWNRQTNSGATRVQVNCQFAETSPNDFMQKYGNVLLFSISETSAVITIRNGEITNVEQIEK